MKYCAFLRGVNVKGTNMKMSEVCRVFQDAGMSNVSAVLGTGNIIFESETERKLLKEQLQDAMSAFFSYDAFLFLKNTDEVRSITEKCPFQKEDNFHIYSFAGLKNIEKILFENFENAGKSEGEEGRIVDGNFYWKVQKGNTLESSFGKILGRKDLKDSFTSRNINTFEKIVNKMK